MTIGLVVVPRVVVGLRGIVRSSKSAAALGLEWGRVAFFNGNREMQARHQAAICESTGATNKQTSPAISLQPADRGCAPVAAARDSRR